MPVTNPTLKNLINLYKTYPDYFLRRVSEQDDLTVAEKEVAKELANCCQMSVAKNINGFSGTGATKVAAYIKAQAKQKKEQKEITKVQKKLLKVDIESDEEKIEREERKNRYLRREEEIRMEQETGTPIYKPLPIATRNIPAVIQNRNDSTTLCRAQLQHYFYHSGLQVELNFYRESVLAIPEDNGELLKDFFNAKEAETLTKLMLKHFNQLEVQAKNYYVTSKKDNIKLLQDTLAQLITRVADAGVSLNAQQLLVEKISADLKAANKNSDHSSYQRSIENIIANHLGIYECEKDLKDVWLVTFRDYANNKNPIDTSPEKFLQQIENVKMNILSIAEIPEKVAEEVCGGSTNPDANQIKIAKEIADEIMNEVNTARYINSDYPERVRKHIDAQIKIKTQVFVEIPLSPLPTPIKTATVGFYNPVKKKNTMDAYLANVPIHLRGNAQHVYEKDANVKTLVDELINWQSNVFDEQIKACIIAILKCCGENNVASVATICEKSLTSEQCERINTLVNNINANETKHQSQQTL